MEEPVKTAWSGRYLDGRTAAVRAARVRLGGEGISIGLEDGTTLQWPYAEVRQAQGSYAGEPVRLERRGGPEALVLDDTDFLYSLRALAPGHSLRFHNPGFRRARVWLTFWTAAASLAVGLAFYFWGIPLLAAFLTPRVPVRWEVQLGRSQLKLLAPASDRIHNARLDRALKAITDRLAGTVPHCPYRFRVTVLDTPMVNAFALPGGFIVVCRGLLEKTRGPAELAGVLAHEMQHVILRHTTRQIIQQSSLGLLISALAGDATGSVALGVQSVRTLALLKYSRADEEEADLGGIRMVMAAGIDPEGMIGFFETLRKFTPLPGTLTFLSNHPATGDRIGRLRQLVASHPRLRAVRRVPLLPGVNWKKLVGGLGR